MGTADRMKTLLAAFAGALLASGAAQAEEMVICTPEYYYNTSENPPFIIPIDEARAGGTRVTRIDLETGAYRQHFIGSDDDILETGALTVVNPGSLRERIDFVALNPANGWLLRISLIDEGLPFVRVDQEGTVASGHCVYE